MTSTLQPPERHQFKVGEAVLYLGTQRTTQPLTPVYAVIIRANSNWIRWPDGHASSVHPGNLVYRGYCAACAVPAVLIDAQLVCPLCHQPAIDCPPPDGLIVRWIPLGCINDQMTARRAALHPDWTWRQAKNDARAAIAAMDALYASFATQLGLPVLTWGKGNWKAEFEFVARMRFYAILGDAEGYRLAYHELEQEQAERARDLSFLNELEALIGGHAVGAGDGPGRASQRLQLAPLDIPRMAADSEPDGADDLTRWLDSQFRRAA